MIEVQFKRNKQLRLKTKLKQALEKAANSSVTVGIHPDAGSYPASGGKEGPTVAEVANWMEKGTAKEDGTVIVPARSFMQSTADENKQVTARLLDRALANIGWHGWTVEKALANVGARFLRAVQNKIKSNVAPELGHNDGSKRYLSRKLALGQPARTLIATGKLLSSLTYKVDLSHSAQREADAARAQQPATTSGTKSGNANRRASARREAGAMKARAAQQRKAFAADKDKQAAFAKQQATKAPKKV